MAVLTTGEVCSYLTIDDLFLIDFNYNVVFELMSSVFVLMEIYILLNLTPLIRFADCFQYEEVISRLDSCGSAIKTASRRCNILKVFGLSGRLLTNSLQSTIFLGSVMRCVWENFRNFDIWNQYIVSFKKHVCRMYSLVKKVGKLSVKIKFHP